MPSGQRSKKNRGRRETRAAEDVPNARSVVTDPKHIAYEGYHPDMVRHLTPKARQMMGYDMFPALPST